MFGATWNGVLRMRRLRRLFEIIVMCTLRWQARRTPRLNTPRPTGGRVKGEVSNGLATFKALPWRASWAARTLLHGRGLRVVAGWLGVRRR